MFWLANALAGQLSVATDLAPWPASGWSAIAQLETRPMRYGVELWAFDYPSAIVGLWNDAEWSRRVDLGVHVMLDHHWRADMAGWHVGISVNTMHSTVTLRGTSGDFWSFEVMPRGGYRWYPGPGERFFVNPWVAFGPLFELDTVIVEGITYNEAPVQLLGTVHMGWRFRPFPS
jgi:hypothetical protein